MWNGLNAQTINQASSTSNIYLPLFLKFLFSLLSILKLLKILVLFESRFDYRVNAQRADKFYPAIRKYYPDLKDGSLEPGYSGIRPKLSGPKQPPVDFVIQVIFVFSKHQRSNSNTGSYETFSFVMNAFVFSSLLCVS